jgi:hypothetical protein
VKIVATGPIAPPTEEILGGLGEIVVAPASDEELEIASRALGALVDASEEATP